MKFIALITGLLAAAILVLLTANRHKPGVAESATANPSAAESAASAHRFLTQASDSLLDERLPSVHNQQLADGLRALRDGRQPPAGAPPILKRAATSGVATKPPKEAH